MTKFQTFLSNQRFLQQLDIIEDSAVLTNYQKELFQLNEKLGVRPKIDKKVLSVAMKFLTKKFNLKESDFDYIGFTDLSIIKKGAKLLQFNITDKNHKSYKSTVAFKYGV